jgi:hypothetical protein
MNVNVALNDLEADDTHCSASHETNTRIDQMAAQIETLKAESSLAERRCYKLRDRLLKARGYIDHLANDLETVKKHNVNAEAERQSLQGRIEKAEKSNTSAVESLVSQLDGAIQGTTEVLTERCENIIQERLGGIESTQARTLAGPAAEKEAQGNAKAKHCAIQKRMDQLETRHNQRIEDMSAQLEEIRHQNELESNKANQIIECVSTEVKIREGIQHTAEETRQSMERRMHRIEQDTSMRMEEVANNSISIGETAHTYCQTRLILTAKDRQRNDNFNVEKNVVDTLGLQSGTRRKLPDESCNGRYQRARLTCLERHNCSTNTLCFDESAQTGDKIACGDRTRDISYDGDDKEDKVQECTPSSISISNQDPHFRDDSGSDHAYGPGKVPPARVNTPLDATKVTRTNIESIDYIVQDAATTYLGREKGDGEGDDEDARADSLLTDISACESIVSLSDDKNASSREDIRRYIAPDHVSDESPMLQPHYENLVTASDKAAHAVACEPLRDGSYIQGVNIHRVGVARKYGDRWLIKRHHPMGILRLGGGSQSTFPVPGKANPRYSEIQAVRKGIAVACCNDDWESYLAPQYAGQPLGYIDEAPVGEPGQEFALFMRRSRNPPTPTSHASGPHLGWEYCGNYGLVCDGTSTPRFEDASRVSSKRKNQLLKKCFSASAKQKGQEVTRKKTYKQWREIDHWRQILDSSHVDDEDEESDRICQKALSLGYHKGMPKEDLYTKVLLQLDEFYPITAIHFKRYDEDIYKYVKEGRCMVRASKASRC